jgi:hypothetical protein
MRREGEVRLLPLRNWLAVKFRLKGCGLLGLGAGILSFVLLGYAYWIEPGWVEVVTVPVPVPGLNKQLNGFRIVQISDIHMSRWMDEKRLDGIVAQVNALGPDVVALTGDFVYHSPDQYLPALSRALANLKAKEATLAVMGNHDYWSGVSAVREALNEAGVRVLRNETYLVRIAGVPQFAISGIDDAWEGQERIERATAQIPAFIPALLLAHEPDFADRYAKTGLFFLQLSGHSHGGQVRLPGIGAAFLPQYGNRYPAGEYQVKQMKLYTNRGLGAVPWHFRFNCRPEITLFLLQAE